MSGLPRLEHRGATTVLSFERLDQRNALNRAVWQRIPELVAAVEDRRETRVLIVRGAGGNFAAGADIGEFDSVFADRATTLAYLQQMSTATAAIAALSIPVIALIEGLCIGAGVAIALACDIRLAAADARLSVTPAKLGLMYSLTDTKRLIDAVGPSQAKGLLFSGRMIDAHRAAAIRLVDEVFEPADLEAAILARAVAIAGASAWSASRAKAVVGLVANGTLTETEQTSAWFADAVETADYREGLAAFRARRKPDFPLR